MVDFQKTNFGSGMTTLTISYKEMVEDLIY